MLRRVLVCAVVCAVSLPADTIVLRSGKTIEGTYLGGDSRSVRVLVGDRAETVAVDDVSEIRFGSGTDAARTPEPRRRVELTRPSRPLEPAGRAAPAASGRVIPEGTSLVVRLIDDVDSQRDKAGQTYRASIDEPVILDGQTVIPQGADVTARLVELKESGKLTGRTELTLDLDSITVDGRTIELATAGVSQQSESRTRETVTRSGGGAALGAIIGAIAGGGKGAAIGAATGAAAGGAVQVLTKGERVRIPSETLLTFTLSRALQL